MIAIGLDKGIHSIEKALDIQNGRKGIKKMNGNDATQIIMLDIIEPSLLRSSHTLETCLLVAPNKHGVVAPETRLIVQNLCYVLMTVFPVANQRK